LVWDRLGAHRSWLTKIHLADQKRWLEVEWLPAYAPELSRNSSVFMRISSESEEI